VRIQSLVEKAYSKEMYVAGTIKIFLSRNVSVGNQSFQTLHQLSLLEDGESIELTAS
jgi:hypothetical protein